MRKTWRERERETAIMMCQFFCSCPCPSKLTCPTSHFSLQFFSFKILAQNRWRYFKTKIVLFLGMVKRKFVHLPQRKKVMVLFIQGSVWTCKIGRLSLMNQIWQSESNLYSNIVSRIPSDSNLIPVIGWRLRFISGLRLHSNDFQLKLTNIQLINQK